MFFIYDNDMMITQKHIYLAFATNHVHTNTLYHIGIIPPNIVFLISIIFEKFKR